MPQNLTDDDEGKEVVTTEGEKIGIIKSVERGTAHVDPDPGMTDELKSKMGWGDRDEDTYRLDENSVETVTDDNIRINRAR
jgi:hypothetical protein